MSRCPACARVNAEHALACEACGTPLVMRCPACQAINVRSRVRCHHCAAVLDTRLRPQDLPSDEPATAPPVVPTLSEPEDEVGADWVLNLLEQPLPREPAAWPAIEAPPQGPADVDAPSLGAQPAAPAVAPAAPPTVAPAPAAASAHGAEDTAQRKVRRRAAVRRAQMRAQGRDHVAAADLPVLDVLVLEANPQARATLCQTLSLFGFRPHVAVSAAEASGLSRRQQHVAAFLGLGSDADPADTEALCRSLHDTRRGRPLALIAIGDRQHHADRIRMQLAGADRMLLRPVGRGDIARALDDCGLPLPQDPRRREA
jgi:CheY-like chemotaxis protein